LTELYGILTTIALLDSTSMLTITTVPMIALMSSQRPVAATLSFIAGTYVTYFACGVLVFLGLDSLFDALLVVVGMPGAVPLFAAIDQILRADLSDAAAVWALLYYTLVFILSLLALVFIRIALGDRSERIFEAVNRFLSVWGARLVIIVLLLLGMVMLADGIGWIVGRSFIPID
jgi:hypothetical protein